MAIRPETRETFQVLSISGGGYRAVYALAALSELEARRNDLVVAPQDAAEARIQECCDAFIGTSAGALVAAGLAIGKTPDELLDIFRENGPDFFPGTAGPGYRTARYSMKKIEGVVRQVIGDRTFAELEKPCFLASVDVETGRSLLVGGYRGSGLFYETTPIWEAVIASISAPTYLPFRKFGFPEGDPANEGTNGWLTDGGLSANAPELIALPDLAANFAVPLRDFVVLSVGTTSVITKLREYNLDSAWRHPVIWARDRLFRLVADAKGEMGWGAIGWFVNGRTHLIELIMKAQVAAAVRVMVSLLPTGHYLRIDTELPHDARIELDDPNKHEVLVGMGQDAVNLIFSPDNTNAYRYALFIDRKVRTHSALDDSLRMANAVSRPVQDVVPVT